MSQPAGWYPQPDGSQRYWDGTQWTSHVVPPAPKAPSAAAMTAPVPAAPAAQKDWYKKKRVIIPALAVVAIIGLAASQGGRGAETASPVVPSASATQGVATVATDEPVDEPTAEATESEEPSEEPEPELPSMTVSQEQAVQKAQEYLDYTSFSRSGLIKQLKFEGFSSADAKFGVDSLDVDWMKQAAIKAQEYLDYTSFSRSGLIKQLEFEGFTRKQAEHGVKSVGL